MSPYAQGFTHTMISAGLIKSAGDLDSFLAQVKATVPEVLEAGGRGLDILGPPTLAAGAGGTAALAGYGLTGLDSNPEVDEWNRMTPADQLSMTNHLATLQREGYMKTPNSIKLNVNGTI